MAATITLTTDFGTRDPYVAEVKGTLLRSCPSAAILDLSHEIAPQSLVEGALFLARAIPRFPRGCVHLVVIDPGVGTERRPIALRAGGQLCVLPDNGLASLLLLRLPLEEARVIEPARLAASGVLGAEAPSATFHGRDIFAPVAGALACGLELSAVGPPAGPVATFDLPRTLVRGSEVRGEVIHVDRFGNLITNIGAESLGGRPCAGAEVAARFVGPVRGAYAEVEPGGLLALWNSAGLLEVAARDGSAAERLRVGVGATVKARLA